MRSKNNALVGRKHLLSKGWIPLFNQKVLIDFYCSKATSVFFILTIQDLEAIDFPNLGGPSLGLFYSLSSLSLFFFCNLWTNSNLH